MVVIICGVAGAGKTTVGKLLAQKLGWWFFDADDFHTAANIEKMKHGTALTDEDRQSWLERLREVVTRALDQNENAVLACSGLKRKYRDRLRVDERVKLVFLRGDFDLIADRLGRRANHFMPPELLRSQFADLEEPSPEEKPIVIEIGRESNELVEEIGAKLV